MIFTYNLDKFLAVVTFKFCYAFSGTPGYLPPEILSQSAVPGWGCDSWALGCVLYFCLVGRPKYFGTTFQEVLRQIKVENGEGVTNDNGCHSVQFDMNDPSLLLESEEIMSSLSSNTKNLMMCLMEIDPRSRLSVTDACTHPFFTEAPHVTLKDGSEGGGIDPTCLHMEDPLKLPQREGGEYDASNVEDKAWARRQCSMVWSPMPQTYDFKNDDGSSPNNIDKVAAVPARRLFVALEKVVINETVEECLSSWLP